MINGLLRREWQSLALLAAIACLALTTRADVVAPAVVADLPRIEDRLPWHDGGVWLQGDIHIHRMLHKKRGPYITHWAMLRGLDFIAASEHIQNIATSKPRERFAALRQRFPGIIVLAGAEWNVPGGDHATIVVDQSPEEWGLLEEFSEKFDRKVAAGLKLLEPDDDGDDGASWGEFSQAIEGLRWLRDRRPEIRSAVFLNHPSRKDDFAASEIGELHDAGLTGVEASAGHQLSSPPGTDRSIDRYEPFIAEIGGDYDTLLASGRQLSLSAGSDFHKRKTSHLPGVFSRTFVYCPERSPTGVLLGLEAGSTALVLGRLATAIETRTSTEGFEDSALIGEILVVPLGAQVTYEVRVRVPIIDYAGQRNRLDRLEIISDCTGEPSLVKVYEQPGHGDLNVSYSLPEAATGQARACFLRARGRRAIGGPGNDQANADTLFYTGATRLIVTGVSPPP